MQPFDPRQQMPGLPPNMPQGAPPGMEPEEMEEQAGLPPNSLPGGPPQPQMPQQGQPQQPGMPQPGMPQDPAQQPPGQSPDQPGTAMSLMDSINMVDDRPSPDDVNYTWGQCCGTCDYFSPPEGCALVNGHIRADGICDQFTMKAGLPDDAQLGDP